MSHASLNIYRRAAEIGLLLVLSLVFVRPAAGEKPIVIPFDFVSKFDDGRYGEMVGDMIWKKLEKEKGFLIPETMNDVRDFCKSKGFKPTPATTIDEMQKMVKDGFEGNIAIWGSVERAPGTEGEIYDLVIKCVDFSSSGEPKMVYECSKRTNSVSEIPHLYVKEMMEALTGRKPGEKSIDPDAEERWKTNPNLVVNGDFERGSGKVPLGWEPTGGQQRELLGNQVKWVTIEEQGGTLSYNRVIRLTMDKGVAESTGVMYYSKPFKVEEGATYRFQCRWRSNGPSPKVFIKCYADLSTRWMREASSIKADTEGPQPKPTKPELVYQSTEDREVYRSQQNLKGPKNQWNVQTEDFTPKHTRYSPRFGRVMLYGYLAPGVIDFDDVVIKQISPPKDMHYKDPRHSLETKVTMREMEANERKSREIREKQREARKKEKESGK